jgi:hypothetical protein
MQRPALTRSLTEAEFRAWYWLKQELVLFCRSAGLTTSGSKLDLQARISDLFANRPTAPTPAAKRTAGAMPATFTLDTLIGPGWRCNPRLGAFLRSVCGNGFHFNAAMRDFIHHGSGKTLADAAICYHASVRPGTPKPAIPTQLQYNQHFRDFFRDHPGATRQQAIDAWWRKRSKPVTASQNRP